VQEAIVADEDELALDGLFGLGPADVGPKGGVGVAALPGERAGDGEQGRPGDELQGERGGDFGRHESIVQNNCSIRQVGVLSRGKLMGSRCLAHKPFFLTRCALYVKV
jgi:hypothetical protein